MVRLYLFAEGQTEQTFAGNVLKPHLAQHGVFMHSGYRDSNNLARGRIESLQDQHEVPMASIHHLHWIARLPDGRKIERTKERRRLVDN